MHKITVPFLILALVLSACGSPRPGVPTETQAPRPTSTVQEPVPSESLAPGATQDPRPTGVMIPALPVMRETPFTVDEFPAFQPAREQIAKDMGISKEEVTVASYEPMEWPDSCLGLGGPAESCLMVITPGYLVFFETPNGQVEAHLANSGQFRLAPSAIP